MKFLACIYVCAPPMCPVSVELELQMSMWVLGTEPGPTQKQPVLLLLHHLSSPRNFFRKYCFYQEVSSAPSPVSPHQTLLLVLPHHHPGCATHPKLTAPPKTEVREMEQAPDQGSTIRAESGVSRKKPHFAHTGHTVHPWHSLCLWVPTWDIANLTPRAPQEPQ